MSFLQPYNDAVCDIFHLLSEIYQDPDLILLVVLRLIREN